MTEATNSCVRELTVEVPAEQVERETQRVTKEFARLARLPGFRPGKAPAQLVRRRFWDDIKGEVLQSLVPTSLEHALREQKLSPVGRPSIAELEFEPEKPLRFKATFEVLPEIQLKDYKGLEAEAAQVEVTEEDLERELAGLQERMASYEPVEDRAAEKGDTVAASLVGVVTQPEERTEPIKLDSTLIHLGAESTLEAFTDALLGVKAGEERKFEVTYPEDYPQAKLAGQTAAFTARVEGVKQKRLPELDDAFAQQVSDAKSLEELKGKIRAGLEEARQAREKHLNQQRVLDALLAKHDFPVPEVLVEHQMNKRLERQVQALAAQGLDPQGVNIDWKRAWQAGRDAAVQEARLGLLVERIAQEENLEASEEELSQEIERLAQQRGETPQAVRGRLTKEGRLDSIKSAIRSEKVVNLLLAHARLSAPSRN